MTTAQGLETQNAQGCGLAITDPARTAARENAPT